MNMQAMLKQAQNMQKDMMKAQDEINNMTFTGENGFVTVTVNGNKTVSKVEIKNDSLDKDDIEMLQDMILVATNDALKQIDKITEEKLGKYTKGIPGLF